MQKIISLMNITLDECYLEIPTFFSENSMTDISIKNLLFNEYTPLPTLMIKKKNYYPVIKIWIFFFLNKCSKNMCI